MAPRVNKKSFAAAVALLATSVGIDAAYVRADNSAFETLDKNLAGKLPSKYIKIGKQNLPSDALKMPNCPPDCKVDSEVAPSAQGKVETYLPSENLKLDGKAPAIQHKVESELPSAQGKVEYLYKEQRLPSEQFKVEIEGVHGEDQPSGI